MVITSSVDSIVEQVTKKHEDKGEHCKGNQTVEKIDQIDFFHNLVFMKVWCQPTFKRINMRSTL